MGGSYKKGGGEKWVKMAGAMDAAIDRMREMWRLVDHLQEIGAREDCAHAHSGNWTPLKNEITAVVDVLRHGLKAR